jgi:hypothetical protein
MPADTSGKPEELKRVADLGYSTAHSDRFCPEHGDSKLKRNVDDHYRNYKLRFHTWPLGSA